MTLHRRALLGSLAASVGSLSGCFNTGDTGSHATPETQTTETRATATPEWAKTFAIFATNHTDEAQSLYVQVERDRELLVDDDFTLAGEPGGDSTERIDEFDREGEYTIRCEATNVQDAPEESTLRVRRDYLDDCNATNGHIALMRDGRINIGLIRTAIDCGTGA